MNKQALFEEEVPKVCRILKLMQHIQLRFTKLGRTFARIGYVFRRGNHINSVTKKGHFHSHSFSLVDMSGHVITVTTTVWENAHPSVSVPLFELLTRRKSYQRFGATNAPKGVYHISAIINPSPAPQIPLQTGSHKIFRFTSSHDVLHIDGITLEKKCSILPM